MAGCIDVLRDTRNRCSGGSELLLSPLEQFGFWAVAGLFGEDYGAAGEVDQVSLSLYAIVETLSDPPGQGGDRCDQVAMDCGVSFLLSRAA